MTAVVIVFLALWVPFCGAILWLAFRMSATVDPDTLQRFLTARLPRF